MLNFDISFLEKHIDPASKINQSDQELKMLEALVDRLPPFIKADGKKR